LGKINKYYEGVGIKALLPITVNTLVHPGVFKLKLKIWIKN
jgi:hypothetical protein